MSILGDLDSALFEVAYTYRIPLAIGGVVVLVALALVARRRGWLGRASRHPRLTAAVLVPTLAIALPIGWYLASPLVLSSTIDEPAPIAAAATPSAAPAATTDSMTPSAPLSPPTRASLTPTPVSLAGTFSGSDEFHFGRGTARLIETSPGKYFVRLEDFAVRNGPDLYVYLSPSPNGYATDAIELGRLKADTGNQNYAVPAGTLHELSAAASVVIWCKQFSHLFATATLAAG